MECNCQCKEIKILKEEFSQVYKQEDSQVYYSPGRVNLIGEHIDYNGGLVFPLAITIGTYGILSKRDDNRYFVYSKGFSTKPHEIKLCELTYNKEREYFWTNYITGVFLAIKKLGFELKQGFNLYISGNIPNGAGLSSSSSLELLIAYILKDLNNFEINRESLALIGQSVENNFIGLNSGIMDQFIIANAKKDNALLLDCKTLKYKHSPFDLKDNLLVVGFTNKKRELADSKYNERFSECQKALEILKKHYQISNLCELSLQQVEKYKEELTPTLYKRVRHVVTEQKRALDFFEASTQGDLETVCKILLEGHKSLQEDYEVTGIELDTLVYSSVKHGALGARQTGAGFGGCMIAIVPKDKVEEYKKEVSKDYFETVGYYPKFFVVESSEGVHKK